MATPPTATELHEELERIDRRRRELLFWLRVRKTPRGCWQWTAYVNNFGYGRMGDGYAHRFAYELMVGPIPAGMQLDHRCCNRSCVNPDHLEAVAQKENILRGEGISAQNAIKTHCPKGHEYTPENTYIQMKRGRPGRSCLICRRARDARRPGR